jgi:hypothetical protein
MFVLAVVVAFVVGFVAGAAMPDSTVNRHVHEWGPWQRHAQGIWTIWLSRSCARCGDVQMREVNP